MEGVGNRFLAGGTQAGAVTIQAALTRLEGLRCDGIEADHHYAIGASVPDTMTQPALFLAFAGTEDWKFQAESYDAQAGSLLVGVALTVITQPFRGRGQSDAVGSLTLWLQRIFDMLAPDLLLGNNLTAPLTGSVRKVGVLQGAKLRYVGIVLDLRLLVRIEAP